MLENRLTALMAGEKKDLLSLYFTAGYPQPGIVKELALACEEAGVDFIEIGIPFSDSLVDGPTIQASNEVALSSGMTVEKLLEEIASIRESVSIPIVLMGCINPLEQFGLEKFCHAVSECGIDGALIADLPPEVFEKHGWKHFQKEITDHE